ncbi:hypothetical protein GCM10020000_83770 [Streptomyces olivoverticillatus]
MSEEGDNAISVIATSTDTVTARLTGFLFPRVSAVTPDGQHLYVPNYGGNTVDVVDLATGTTIASVPGFTLPFMVAITRDGTLAYVSNNGESAVVAIDTATHTVVRTCGGLNTPYYLAVIPDELHIYVVNNGASTVSVLPGFTGLYPDQGPTGGGTPVTIRGTHLTGTTAVHFGNRLATHVLVLDDNEVTCVTPAEPGRRRRHRHHPRRHQLPRPVLLHPPRPVSPRSSPPPDR